MAQAAADDAEAGHHRRQADADHGAEGEAGDGEAERVPRPGEHDPPDRRVGRAAGAVEQALADVPAWGMVMSFARGRRSNPTTVPPSAGPIAL